MKKKKNLADYWVKVSTDRHLIVIYLFSTSCGFWHTGVNTRRSSLLTHYNKIFFFHPLLFKYNLQGAEQWYSFSTRWCNTEWGAAKCSHEKRLSLIFTKAWCEGRWTYVGAIRRGWWGLRGGGLEQKTAWVSDNDFPVSEWVATIRAGYIHAMLWVWILVIFFFFLCVYVFAPHRPPPHLPSPCSYRQHLRFVAHWTRADVFALNGGIMHTRSFWNLSGGGGNALPGRPAL